MGLSCVDRSVKLFTNPYVEEGGAKIFFNK